MKISTLFVATLLFLGLPAAAVAQAAPEPAALTYELAKQAAEAAEAEARRNSWNVTIVIVDAAGVPVYLKRMDGASARTYDFAMGKARTSAATGLTTLVYTQRVRAGEMEAIPDATTIEGGIPIMIGGELAGAIAASGLPPQQDAVVAQAGADAITR